jgi:hypothetical protein
MAQQVRVGGQPNLRRQAGEGTAGMVGVDGVPRSVRNTRSSSTGRGGRPGSTQRSSIVEGWPTARRSRSCSRRWWRSVWTANGGRVRMALLAADLTGPTLVECKLRANREIRREVVGQILAYAGGLARLSYEEFAAGFRKRAGQPLDSAVAQATGEEVDGDQLREAVSQRLASGEFRLIIAVDQITPELRLVVEYLNGHTVAGVQVLALELNYTKDGDVELLVPMVYGQEAVARKATSTGWTAETFTERLEQLDPGPARAFLERLLAHGSQHGHHPFYGSGANPSVSQYYSLGGRPVSVWALYLRPTGPVLNLSLGGGVEMVARSGVGVPAGSQSRPGSRRGARRPGRGHAEPIPAPGYPGAACRAGGARALLCRPRPAHDH